MERTNTCFSWFFFLLVIDLFDPYPCQCTLSACFCVGYIFFPGVVLECTTWSALFVLFWTGRHTWVWLVPRMSILAFLFGGQERIEVLGCWLGALEKRSFNPKKWGLPYLDTPFQTPEQISTRLHLSV